MASTNPPVGESRAIHEFTNILMESDLIIDNTNSEPRDILMTERTGLTWIKFSITLSAIAITIITNFRIDTSGKGNDHYKDQKPPKWLPKFSYGVSILFVLLSMCTLFVGGISYVQSVYNYRLHRVNTYSFATALAFLFFIGVILLAINIVFMIAVKGG
jgi:uncharacterized membrane protein YidH (DUF202 family)